MFKWDVILDRGTFKKKKEEEGGVATECSPIKIISIINFIKRGPSHLESRQLRVLISAC